VRSELRQTVPSIVTSRPRIFLVHPASHAPHCELPDPKFHELWQGALDDAFADATPAEFFELVSCNATQFSLKTEEETAFDLRDVVDLSHANFQAPLGWRRETRKTPPKSKLATVFQTSL
jgi:hypothetical protein